MSKEPDKVTQFPDQEGRELMLATQKGEALNNAWRASTEAGLQQVMGEKFLVTQTGLEIAPGQVPTRNDVSQGLSNLARGTESLNMLKAVIMWNLGDLAIISEQFGAEDEVITNAIKITGQTKHNVLQAIRVCRFFPKEKRVPGWFISMHTEVANHAGRFKDDPEVLDEVIEKAKEIPDLTCAELRKMLQEASGHPVMASGTQSRPNKDRYLYFADTGEIFKSDDLAISALRDRTAIGVDMYNFQLLGPEGFPCRTIGEAPDEWFLNPIPQEEDEEPEQELDIPL